MSNRLRPAETTICLTMISTADPQHRSTDHAEGDGRFDLNSLRGLVDAHLVVRHSFLRRFRAGRWSRPQVRFWAEQQFYFSISLPSAFAAIYARVPDRCWKEKRELVKLLSAEAWGSDGLRCHSHYFVELCQFLEVDIQQLTKRTPRPYTDAYLQLRLAICLEPHRPIAQGLAAIAIGNEILNLYIYRAYRDGIHKIPGCEDCPTGYFDAHLNDEEADAEVFRRLFDATVSTDAEFRAAGAGLLELLDARVTFFDALTCDLHGTGSAT